MCEKIKTMSEIANQANVRIVNETGVANDIKVFINDKPVGNIVSVEIGKLNADSDFITAKIEFLGVKLDIAGKLNETND